MNETEHNLQRVELRLPASMNAGPGELAKGEYATVAFLEGPIPSDALATWDENSNHHEVTVRLGDVVPPGFDNSTIYFILRADGSVTIKTANIRDSNAKQEILKDVTERRELPNP